MNSLTVNLHLLMVSFYRPTEKRYKILVESDIFPSDLYAVESQIRFHGFDPSEALIKWHPRKGEHTLHMEDLHEILDREGGTIALIMLGCVNYYTGQAFDMQGITRLGHDRGITVGFDLAHGAGNIELNLHDWDVDFACWCTYKYLNSGPGGLSGIFVHERYARAFELPRFTGWWGHNKETRFGMRDPFDPLPGAEGWQLSNPPILPMATLRASLESFHNASMPALRKKSVQLTGFLEELLLVAQIPGLEIITPLDPEQRGCQLSLFLHSGGKSIFEKITEAGIIADWREPNVIRIAPVPLYNSFEDVWRFVVELEKAVG
jgi:kynureninase